MWGVQEVLELCEVLGAHGAAAVMGWPWCMVWGTVWGGWCGQSLPAWCTMGLGVSEMGGEHGFDAAP